ncbi:hypothetical protein IQ274_35460 [Nostoc sp. LEGE 12447]|uniref:hypothetical protein n=1 Tax=Nostoc sp. CALU 546 TaxID=1867241 RepID=UPI001A0ADCBE|nr:hypothetical protein [Nostoc sp. LEGE 12447]
MGKEAWRSNQRTFSYNNHEVKTKAIALWHCPNQQSCTSVCDCSSIAQERKRLL